MNRYEFRLDISAGQYMDYYRGAVLHVVALSTTGQTVQFPASLLQRFVTAEGIHGHFVLTCDENHKCTGLERVPEAPK
ncbi:MAG: DUF2835 domain-containing protein [Verrucomicrobiota bacterium]|jgi:hypothetical protein